jgi:hypothetical protein
LQEIGLDVKVIVSTSLSQAKVKSRTGHLELPTYLQKHIDVDMLLNIVQLELTNRVSLPYPNHNFGCVQTTGNRIKLGSKLKPQAIPLQPAPRKTTADFLRWLKKRRALEKLEKEELKAETDKAMKQALMI